MYFNRRAGFTHVIVLIVSVIILAVIGVGSYFLYTKTAAPLKVKEKVTVIHPIFTDFSKAVKKSGEHLKEPSGKDAGALERYAERGKGELKTTEDTLSALKPLVDSLSLSEMSAYKQKVSDAISKSDKVISLEKANLQFSEGYVQPLKDYEQLTISIAGVGQYLYTDPARYVKEVSEAVAKEDAIIKTLKGLTIEGDFKDYHESFIKTIEVEKEALESMSKAVENRDNNAINTAVKNYASAQKKNADDVSRIKDELEKKINDAIDDADSAIELVNKEYDDLRRAYNF